MKSWLHTLPECVPTVRAERYWCSILSRAGQIENEDIDSSFSRRPARRGEHFAQLLRCLRRYDTSSRRIEPLVLRDLVTEPKHEINSVAVRAPVVRILSC